MFTQLNPPIPLHVLGKGDGHALAVIDYGLEHNLIWVTALDDNGELWCAPNPQVRMLRNWTIGRRESRLVAEAKAAHRTDQAASNNAGMCTDCSGEPATQAA